MEHKKKIIPIVISIIAIILIVIGASYAWFTLTLNGTKSNVLKAGTLSLILNDENSVGISEENALPMLDEDGEQTEPYHFTLVNDGSEYVEYTIYLDDEDLLENETRMVDSNIKYNLVKNATGKTDLLSNLGVNPNRILDRGTIAGGQTITYDLRLWIDQDATSEIMGQVLRGKLRVEASQVKKTVLKDTNLNMTVIGNNEIGLTEMTPMSDEEGSKVEPYQFTLKNTTDTESEYAILLDDVATFSTRSVGASDDKIKYQLKKDNEVIATDVLSETIVGEERVLDTGKMTSNSTSNYELRLWIDSSVSPDEASAMTFNGSLRVSGEKRNRKNKNIVAIYQYNANNCITGEESTCVKVTIAPTTYSAGTIIKYKVNDMEEKYFHVISDNGTTLTMQQRENTIYATPWYETVTDNRKGPLTVLPALENATANWTNVKDQTYTMGSTTFKDNAYTGCSWTSCTANTYTLGSRTGKARMITIQETNGLGCTNLKKSCPNWMNNYLYDSTSYGGTVNVTGGEYGNNWGYWTMSAWSSDASQAMMVDYISIVSGELTVSMDIGARAVVVIDK